MAITSDPSPNLDTAFLLGGGEMGERIRSHDWSRTPLGPAARWPRSLKTAVRILLTSRQPMFVWWGEELINLYNDPYRSIAGGKHPAALGQPAAKVWREIWDQIAPRAESALRKNEGTYDEALLLIMERHGYREETYYTFSYSPIPDDEGGTGGIFCANTDETARILGERRVTLLRELSTAATDARTVADACRLSAAALDSDARDVPFALLYLLAADGRHVDLVGTAGLAADHCIAAQTLALDATSSPWPIAAVLESQRTRVLDVPSAIAPTLPSGPWECPPQQVVTVPIARSGETGPSGVLVAGLNPFRPFDDDYRGFFELVTSQLAATVAGAHAYEEERRRAETLAEVDRAKTAFFSNVSHEFRTPLTLMLGPIEELRATGHAEQRERLDLLQRNALRLQKLVNTLLDFSRIEAGRIRASFEPTELATFTADLASTFRSACDSAGLAFRVDCPPLAEPAWVDRDLWEKIVLNLLSNAFKFTLAGAIRVELGEQPGLFVLQVHDTGSGIASEDLPHVFDRFRRVEGVAARTHEGTGIGLALVQELVRLHGGQVRVTSTPGRGTTFRVELPRGHAHLDPAQLATRARAAHPTEAARAYVGEALRWLPDTPTRAAGGAADDRLGTPLDDDGRARILLADDNADMRHYVRGLLSERFAVEAVPDGEAALAALRERPFDLVLSDVMMPRLDGFGLLRELRADERTRGIPVILLSARAGEEAQVEGLERGADDYLVKPFSAGELVARVAARLELARLRREVEDALREADQRKDEFLATLAHELRNPLAPIRNALHALRVAGASGATADRLHAMMERQVNHMVRLVDDLLEVSRITRGKIELRPELVPVAEVVRAAIETSRPLIDAGRHELDVALPDERLFLEADPVRLAQVIGNLLNNAAKYTPRGGRIRVAVERRDGEVVILVRDDGVGIPVDMLPRVFDLFTQVDRTLASAQGGLGIGLTLVRRIVELHGGRVEARSDGANRGSEFVVALPLAPSPVASTDALADGLGPGSLPERRVLIVDDNADAAESLGVLLRMLGADVVIANDGPTALATLQHFRPSLILLDIGMPGMHGYEVATRVRALPALDGVLLVALTGWGQSEDRQRSHAAGFDHHLVKPIDLAALQALLQSA